MNIVLTENIKGMVDKSSNMELKLQEVYMNNKKTLFVTATINLIPDKDVNSTNNVERFNLLVLKDEDVIINEKIEVNLSQKFNKTFEKEIDINNYQYEVHMFSMSISNIVNDKIEYASIREILPTNPIKDLSIYINLNYYKIGNIHRLSYNTNSKSRVFLKMNNRNWKEMTEEVIDIENKDLEGKINYVQAYVLNDENQKIYSGLVKIIKQ